MKWEGRRQSENVEVAENVEHPVYGQMETLTNMAHGEVVQVTPTGLSAECKHEMGNQFALAAAGEPAGFMSSVSQLIGSLTQTPCDAKVSAFFNEYSRGEGFEIAYTNMGWQALRLVDAPAEQPPLADQQAPAANARADMGMGKGM